MKICFNDMASLVNYFIDKKFNVRKYNKIITHPALVVGLNHDKLSFIIVQSEFDGNKFVDELQILQHLQRDIRYILLFDPNAALGMFAKLTVDVAGKLKTQKYKFSINSKSAKILLDSLQPNDLRTFESIFKTEKIVKKFYLTYKKHLVVLTNNIRGISDKNDRGRYADITMSRLMFIQFLQTRNFFSDKNFLLFHYETLSPKISYYDFLCMLFFDILNTPISKRKVRVSKYSHIPFLNGGLFKKHSIEHKYQISISNNILHELLVFLKQYTWYVDETDVSNDGINPEILGHIFEQTIDNQKEQGAYYTPVDVTKFICTNTILPYCIERINTKFETNYEPNTDSISKICSNPTYSKYFYFNILKPIKILDNACGSGEFLLTSFGILLNLYIAIWDSISTLHDPLIVSEQKLIDKFHSAHYYFRRVIVTENLFGVDMDEAAIEICRLRLWLGLVADMSITEPEPLPNIDYNILPGNSLLGFVNSGSLQSDLLTQTPTAKIYDKIVNLKKSYNRASDPDEAAHKKNKLDEILHNSRTQLTLALYKIKKQYTKPQLDHQPFHWLLEFPFIIRNNCGFDIIVGNPPYIEKTNTEYCLPFKLLSCGNTYAYFIERSLDLLRPNGKLGYIVPISSVSTLRMSPMIELMLSKCSNMFISNYDDRPSKLFVGLEHCRSSIFICTVSHPPCSVFTTGYKRWKDIDRESIFDSSILNAVNSSKFVLKSRLGNIVPKLDSIQEINILNKLLLIPTSVSTYVTKPKARNKTPYPVFYHNAPQYWIRAVKTETGSIRILNGKKHIETSKQLKPIYCENLDTQIIVTGLLNSSLFYWWYIKLSDGRHLLDSTIRQFPIDVSQMHCNKQFMRRIRILVKDLLLDYDKHITHQNYNKSKNETLIVPEYHPGHSKHIIDKIDDLLAPYYNFNITELNFIKNFDLNFRLSQ